MSEPPPTSAKVEHRIRLARPLRGAREISVQFGAIAQPVLALDHSFNTVALPSVFDAGERFAARSAPCDQRFLS